MITGINDKMISLSLSGISPEERFFMRTYIINTLASEI
jgi:hypothetical protein